MVAIELLAGTKNANIHKLAYPGANQSLLNVLSINYILSEFILVLYFISPYLFIKITFDVIRFYSISYKNQTRSNQLEIEKLNIETDFLKAQLNPHFLFNTLNNLYGLVLKKDAQAPQIVLQLSSIMRYILYESNLEKVLLSKEIAFIKSYILLEKVRYNTDENIVWDIDESNILNQKIAPLLTFVFAENAFKYGLRSLQNAFLKIKIFVDSNNIFYFSCANDKEFNDEILKKDKKFGGIGIQNIRKRLELLYPEKYKLTISDTDDSFEVNLKIQLE